jgi:hypothetical protein
MNYEAIFKTFFEAGMKNSDYRMFKREYPTLLKCILGAMNEVAHKSIVEKAFASVPEESHKRIEQLCDTIEQQLPKQRVVRPQPTKGWEEVFREHIKNLPPENVALINPLNIENFEGMISTKINPLTRDVVHKFPNGMEVIPTMIIPVDHIAIQTKDQLKDLKL